MIDLIQQLCNMAGRVKHLIAETGDPRERKILWFQYQQVVEKIDAATGKVFKENDDDYQEVINTFKETATLIQKYKAHQADLKDLLVDFIDIFEKIDRLILLWKQENEET